VQNALHPVNAAVKDAADQISDLARQSPDFKFQINGAKATSWLLTTFLDSVSPTSTCDAGLSVTIAWVAELWHGLASLVIAVCSWKRAQT